SGRDAREPLSFPEKMDRRGGGLFERHRIVARAESRRLALVLLSRDRLRTLEAMAARGKGFPQGARAQSGPASNTQLPRLYLGRHGREPRRGPRHAGKGGEAGEP